MVFGILLFSRIILGGLERFHLHLESGVHSQIRSKRIDILKKFWRTDNYTNASYTREPAVRSLTAFNDWPNWRTREPIKTSYMTLPTPLPPPPQLHSIQPSRQKQAIVCCKSNTKHQSLDDLFFELHLYMIYMS